MSVVLARDPLRQAMVASIYGLKQTLFVFQPRTWRSRRRWWAPWRSRWISCFPRSRRSGRRGMSDRLRLEPARVALTRSGRRCGGSPDCRTGHYNGPYGFILNRRQPWKRSTTDVVTAVASTTAASTRLPRSSSRSPR